jgi:hypothetical protein
MRTLIQCIGEPIGRIISIKYAVCFEDQAKELNYEYKGVKLEQHFKENNTVEVTTYHD